MSAYHQLWPDDKLNGRNGLPSPSYFMFGQRCRLVKASGSWWPIMKVMVADWLEQVGHGSWLVRAVDLQHKDYRFESPSWNGYCVQGIVNMSLALNSNNEINEMRVHESFSKSLFSACVLLYDTTKVVFLKPMCQWLIACFNIKGMSDHFLMHRELMELAQSVKCYSFIPDIYIAPLQETYLDSLSVQIRPKRNVLRSLQKEDTLFWGSKRSVRVTFKSWFLFNVPVWMLRLGRFECCPCLTRRGWEPKRQRLCQLDTSRKTYSSFAIIFNLWCCGVTPFLVNRYNIMLVCSKVWKLILTYALMYSVNICFSWSFPFNVQNAFACLIL